MNNIFYNLKKYNNKIALISEGTKKISYAELLKKSEQVSKSFDKEKKLAIILSENSIEFIISYVACILSNLTVMLLDSDTDSKELLKLILKFRAGFVLSSKQHNILKLTSLKNKKNNIYIYKTNIKNNIIKNKKLSLLLPTSGSTGESKFVKLTNLNLLTNTRDIANSLNIKKTDRTITTLSPNYSYGISIINSNLFMGANLVINKYNFLDKRFWSLFKKFKPNNFGAVPFMIEILEKINFGSFRKVKLRYITQAGGYLNDNLKKKLLNFTNKNKIKVFFMYGQTEASPRITIMHYKYANKYTNSVGLPIGQNKIFVKKKGIKKLYKFGEGEVVCKGKNIFIGYANKFVDLNKIRKIKYLKTGDLGRIDKNGFLYIIGRNKRISKLFGIRVELNQFEKKLKSKLNLDSVCHVSNNMLFIKAIKKKKIGKFKINKMVKNLVRIPPNFININFVKFLNKNKDKRSLNLNIKN